MSGVRRDWRLSSVQGNQQRRAVREMRRNRKMPNLRRNRSQVGAPAAHLRRERRSARLGDYRATRFSRRTASPIRPAPNRHSDSPEGSGIPENGSAAEKFREPFRAKLIGLTSFEVSNEKPESEFPMPRS